MKRTKKKTATGALLTIVSLLALSAVLRFGGIGIAVANETGSADAAEQAPMLNNCPVEEDLDDMFELIRSRTAVLDDKELELAERSYALDAAQELIEQNLERLAAAEKRLEDTISRVDGAAADDIDRLTAVYAAMKPKVAAALFEQMTPEFAAGFLGRMNPVAASGIMSGLSSEAGYAISVVLAGRNANVPTQ